MNDDVFHALNAVQQVWPQLEIEFRDLSGTIPEAYTLSDLRYRRSIAQAAAEHAQQLSVRLNRLAEELRWAEAAKETP